MEAANYTKNHLHVAIGRSKDFDTDLEAAMINGFHTTDNLFIEKAKREVSCYFYFLYFPYFFFIFLIWFYLFIIISPTLQYHSLPPLFLFLSLPISHTHTHTHTFVCRTTQVVLPVWWHFLEEMTFVLPGSETRKQCCVGIKSRFCSHHPINQRTQMRRKELRTLVEWFCFMEVGV